MNDYYSKEPRSESLQHWKYIKKIPVGKGYRYFYSWEEYKAYLQDPTAELQNKGREVADKVESAGRNASSEFQAKKDSYKKRLESARGKSKDYYKAKAAAGERFVREHGGQIRSKGKKLQNEVNDRANQGADWIEKRGTKIRSQSQEAYERYKEDRIKTQEAVERVAREGDQWIKSKRDKIRKDAQDAYKRLKNEVKEKKQERINKKEAEREALAKKYKYIKRVKVNGKYVYFYSQEEVDAYNKRKEYRANEPDFLKDVKHTDVPLTKEEDSILVNPRYDPDDRDYSYEFNCAECSAIYELRRRGYDVTSNGANGLDWETQIFNSDDRFNYIYENPNVQIPKATNRLNPEETYNVIKGEIEKNPPGSRGELSFAWKDGGGHSVNWEIDSKGEIHIIDNQLSGNGGRTEYDLKSLCYQIDNSPQGHNSSIRGRSDPATDITRTDNLTFKDNVMDICKESPDRRVKPGKSIEFYSDFRTYSYHSPDEEELVTKYPTLSRK